MRLFFGAKHLFKVVCNQDKDEVDEDNLHLLNRLAHVYYDNLRSPEPSSFKELSSLTLQLYK